ncbi:hemin uptake protein HemP [Azonexus fungiphilus]|jgi:hemin uptake protein HemP|uniref:Hemin uptake protein HemP n=1 Tax=Azonexus fungiphilus TaxID=146940 RepID=A0A495WDI9_9RHOO|nr:hemin uptake protein HemP [Azonexus fungiphilus]NHC05882.1 hemin uptake protein HemP [Azonexus fungiphilus]RKT59264.1 hemin uptake protein HemP [Azonexus fungiphilus]
MNSQPKSVPSASPPPAAGNLPRLDSGQILQGASTVEIEHAGQRYLLRVTRENKLILTK